MEWEIQIISQNKYIEVITSGIADKAGSLNMAHEMKKTMKAHRITKALIDHRNLIGVTGDILDIYERPKIFRLIGLIFKIRIAEIIRPEHLDHFSFFETVCVNQGIQLFVFQDREKALSWLLR